MTETAYEYCPDCGQPIWQLTRIGGDNKPDTDTRCNHHDAAGQCLDHQGHQGRHQPPAKEQPRSAVYVPGEVSEAEAEQIKAAIQTLPPDTDTRCSHQDGAGQCLDHQGHQGRHQPPNWVETIRTLVARCENFVPPTDCQSAGRDPQSPYSADGYCLSCKVRRVLQGDHQPPTPPLSVSEG